jgi:hypothetical protein
MSSPALLILIIYPAAQLFSLALIISGGGFLICDWLFLIHKYLTGGTTYLAKAPGIVGNCLVEGVLLELVMEL